MLYIQYMDGPYTYLELYGVQLRIYYFILKKKPYQPVDLEVGEVNPIETSPQEEGTNESPRTFLKL